MNELQTTPIVLDILSVLPYLPTFKEGENLMDYFNQLITLGAQLSLKISEKRIITNIPRDCYGLILQVIMADSRLLNNSQVVPVVFDPDYPLGIHCIGRDGKGDMFDPCFGILSSQDNFTGGGLKIESQTLDDQLTLTHPVLGERAFSPNSVSQKELLIELIEKYPFYLAMHNFLHVPRIVGRLLNTQTNGSIFIVLGENNQFKLYLKTIEGVEGKLFTDVEFRKKVIDWTRKNMDFIEGDYDLEDTFKNILYNLDRLELTFSNLASYPYKPNTYIIPQ
jgi:hypothetical protein